MKFRVILLMVVVLSAIVHAAPVPLHCWILGQDDGTASFDASDVTNLVDGVNRIYHQVAMTFKIESISYTNNSWLADLEYTNSSKIASVCGITNNTGGVELYFVNSLVGNATAFNRADGIVIGPNANYRTLAHEIGHACGLRDIYDSHSGTTLSVTGMPTKAYMPDDWGWYHPSLTQRDLVERLLMYGYRSSSKADLSYGDVYGLYYTSSWDQVSRKWIRHWNLGNAPVGFVTHGNRHPVSQ